MKVAATVAFTFSAADGQTLEELEAETEHRIAGAFATEDVRVKLFFPRGSWAEANARQTEKAWRRRETRQ
jgi:hypothetical protein